MPEDAEHRPYCHACGQLIDGPVRTYRCPACGSCDVALTASPRKPDESLADRAGRSTLITRIAPIRYFFPTPPRGMPPALWGHLRPLRVLCGSALILTGLGVVAFVSGLTSARHGVIAAGMVSCFLASMTPYLAKRRLRRFAQEIIADNFERCLQCDYSLKGLPDKHRCPECGEPYDITLIKDTWRRYFEEQKNKK